MSKKVSYYTKDGLEKLKNELSELKTKGRADIARQIAEARDKGDLSENAEYDAAKDAQGHLEAKIAQLEDLMANARLLDESNVDTSKVSILSKVTIKNKRNGASFTYTLVSEEEADLKTGKISKPDQKDRTLSDMFLPSYVLSQTFFAFSIFNCDHTPGLEIRRACCGLSGCDQEFEGTRFECLVFVNTDRAMGQESLESPIPEGRCQG